MTKTVLNIENEYIVSRIHFIRGKRVMLDSDLAKLYIVETKVLNQAVKRNIDRFPSDFMFQLTSDEYENLKSHIVTSSWGGSRKLPFAFTEHGILQLSSVLRSKIAIEVNIEIMRTFTKLRNLVETSKELRDKIEALEQKYDHQFKIVFDTIKQLLYPKEKPKKIGFLR
jgi:hypothetical protein